MYFEIVFGVAAVTVAFVTYATLMLPASEPEKVDDKKMFWEGSF